MGTSVTLQGGCRHRTDTSVPVTEDQKADSCENPYDKGKKSFSFPKFPLTEPRTPTLEIKGGKAAVRREDLKPSKHSGICWEHFGPGCTGRQSNSRLLRACCLRALLGAEPQDEKEDGFRRQPPAAAPNAARSPGCCCWITDACSSGPRPPLGPLRAPHTVHDAMSPSGRARQLGQHEHGAGGSPRPRGSEPAGRKSSGDLREGTRPHGEEGRLRTRCGARRRKHTFSSSL